LTIQRCGVTAKAGDALCLTISPFAPGFSCTASAKGAVWISVNLLLRREYGIRCFQGLGDSRRRAYDNCPAFPGRGLFMTNVLPQPFLSCVYSYTQLFI
jgi:hypothetical protein